MTDEVERRLRSALGARAGQITQDRLRFGMPPTAAVPERPFSFPFLPWLAALSGAAVAALVLGSVLLSGEGGTEPIQPVAPPAPASAPAASPSALSSPPRPGPSVSAPSSSPAATASSETSSSGSGPSGRPPSAEQTPSSALSQSSPSS